MDVIVSGEPRKNDMVMDFGDLKTIVEGYINMHLDHRFMVRESYVEGLFSGNTMTFDIPASGMRLFLPDKSVALLDFEPTSENLARHLHKTFEKLFPDLTVDSITVYEGENNHAQYP